MAVLLNIYQAMYVHHFLKTVYQEDLKNNQEEDQPNSGLLQTLKSYMSSSNKPFFYNIGGFNFSLEELKHGLLRNNQYPPGKYRKTLSDSRVDILKDYHDPRINFVCLDYPTFLEHIDPFDGSTEEKLDECLEQFVSDILNANTRIDMDEGSVTLP